MISADQCKAAAKLQIRGKIGVLFLMTMVMELVSGLAAILPPLAYFVIAPAFSLGLLMVHLRIAKNAVRQTKVKEIFDGFEWVWPSFKATFLTALYTALWALLLIVPGIIKAISYSQTMYIVAEDPSISTKEAIRRSSEMMEGHKMEFFMLQLSFFGWLLLSGLTFGILLIWLTPYMNATNTNFYLALKQKKERQDPFAPQ